VKKFRHLNKKYLYLICPIPFIRVNAWRQHESNFIAFSFGFWGNYENLMKLLGNSWHENQPHSQAFYSSSFWLLAVCKNRGRRPEEFHYVICGTTIIMSSRLLSTAKRYTRPILHSILATKIGQAPSESYTPSIWSIPRLKATTPKGYRV